MMQDAATLPDVGPYFEAGNRLIQGWMAVGNEIIEFGQSRIDRSLEMGRAMAQSTSFNEALDVQATFTRATVQDYLSEAGKLTELSTQSLLDSFSTLRKPVRETIARVGAAAE
jgi:hypothetical protein